MPDGDGSVQYEAKEDEPAEAKAGDGSESPQNCDAMRKECNRPATVVFNRKYQLKIYYIGPPLAPPSSRP